MDQYWGAVNNDPNQFLYNTYLNWGVSNNNGNLYGVTEGVGGPTPQTAFPYNFTQTFTYDSANRLQTASDSGGRSRNYGYDEYGNMWVGAAGGVGLSPATATSDVYNSATNQKANESYDAAGNQTTMGGMYAFSYDAENRQISEANTVGNPAAQYAYDGDGHRVQKTVGATTTIYVYDALSHLAAEYTNSPSGTPPCQTCYLTADHLGSTRLVSDERANIVSLHDYLPFGEEIPGNSVGRGSLFGPGTDNVNQKFTGQERDSESGLDYFGARYYGSALGRFTSADPITATPLHIVNPQRWNMYAYAVNNPLAYTDPDGRDAIAVNFTKEVPLGGHEGIISVHADGTAEYARFGPVGGGKPFGAGQVDTLNLNPVQFGSDGLPTGAAYKDLAQQVAGFEHQDPSTVRMNYFKTSEADTLAVDAWIKRLKDASDRKQAPAYDVTRQNCAVFCIAGLIQGNAIQNRNISLVPNTLFQLLSGVATENYSNGQRSPKEQVTSKICYTDENGKQVCQ